MVWCGYKQIHECVKESKLEMSSRKEKKNTLPSVDKVAKQY